MLDATKPSLSSTLPTTAKTGEAVAFSASASDVWSSVTTSWSFGGGATASGTSTSHTYTTAGTYTVTVTATDAAGNARSVTGQLTVTAAPASTGDSPPATPPNTGGTPPGTAPDTSRRAPIQLPASLLTFPPSRGCVSTATLTVGLTPRAGVTYRQARIELTAGKKTITRTVAPRTITAKARKRTVIPISLKGLPRGSLRLAITVTTADEHVLTAKRAYRTCTAKAKERRASR
ncbi:PKD domain-containing protein [Svornostia abyssi]|uniref:PKD domain-containing protein n=1 Tax=Svornostia abyssi TaxID=2898438 RepID=A0ABY5PNT5_9ACTN|nr:PKD domain-containing protein [Parviterribacteraceae bacterium J379]